MPSFAISAPGASIPASTSPEHAFNLSKRAIPDGERDRISEAVEPVGVDCGVESSPGAPKSPHEYNVKIGRPAVRFRSRSH
jgi:hypothetical protein